MVGVSFDYPYLLFLLFLIPVYIFIYFVSMIYNRKKAILFSNFEALERISDVEIFSKGLINLYLGIVVLILMVFASAGTYVNFNAESSKFAYVIVIDNSASMKTSDLGESRLEAAKGIAKDFVNGLQIGSEVGVIEFSGETNILQKLDTSKLKTSIAIDSVDYGDVSGTNLYDAVIGADRLMETRNAKSILLISDGQFNLGNIDQISSYILRNNIIVNSILTGTDSGGVSEFNTTSTADASVMQQLSFESEGKILKFQGDGLDGSLSSLSSSITREVSINITTYLMVLVIILLLISWILYNFRFRAIP
jgi:hypothetical protein